MKIVAKPIDIIVTFRNGQKPTPYKFQYLEINGEKRVMIIDKVIDIEESKTAGIASIIYTCQTAIDNLIHIYQLKYIVNECKWQLYKL